MRKMWVILAVVMFMIMGCSDLSDIDKQPDKSFIDVPDHDVDLAQINARLDAIEALNAIQDARLDILEGKVSNLEAQDVAFKSMIEESSNGFLAEVARLDGVDADMLAEMEMFAEQTTTEFQSLMDTIADETSQRQASDEELLGMIQSNASGLEAVGIKVEELQYCISNYGSLQGPRLRESDDDDDDYQSQYENQVDCDFVRNLASDMSRMQSNIRSLDRSIDSLRYSMMRKLGRLEDDMDHMARSFSRDISALSARISMNSFAMVMMGHQLNQKIDSKVAYLKRLINANTAAISNNTAAIVQNTANIRGLTAEINSINDMLDEMSEDQADMQTQLDEVQAGQFTIVYPCGEGNSKEVIIDTPSGLLAYFQEGRTREFTKVNITVIPEHYTDVCIDTEKKWMERDGSGECRHNGWEKNYYCEKEDVCVEYEFISETTTTDFVQGTFQEETKEYLSILDNGSYRTTDGYSCNFTVSEGEIQ